MSKVTRRKIQFKDLRWTVYNQDDPDQVFAEELTGPESDRLIKKLLGKRGGDRHLLGSQPSA